MSEIREVVSRMMSGEDVELDTLDDLQVRIAAEVAAADDLQAERDPRVATRLDLLRAMRLLEPTDDPAVAWNRACVASEAGHYGEAALDWLAAARGFEEAIAAGKPDLPDEQDWANTAIWHACRDFIRSGAVVSAAVLLKRLTGEDRGEILAMLNEHLGTAAD